MDSFQTWIQSTFVDNYFRDVDYLGKALPWREKLYLADTTSYKLGPARLRQLRGSSGNCGTSYHSSKALISLGGLKLHECILLHICVCERSACFQKVCGYAMFAKNIIFI